MACFVQDFSKRRGWVGNGCLRVALAVVLSIGGGLKGEPEKLAPAFQKLLDEQGFVVTGKKFKQGFSAYLQSRPAFITSDSLLMAYTTLLERLVGVQYQVLMGAHFEWVPAMVRQLPEAAKGAQGGRETRLLMGSAYRILLGSVPEGITKEEGKLIERKGKRVEKAEGTTAPEWWKSQTYVPYSRFAPPSTWNTSEPLRRFWRYYQWMMSLPFEKENELHLAVCKTIGGILAKLPDGAWEYAIHPSYSGVEDGGILLGLSEIQSNDFFDAERLPESRIEELFETNSYLISPRRSPEAALLDDFLRRKARLDGLTRAVSEALASNQENNELLFDNWSHESLFFQALKKLRGKVDERAPELFRLDVWKQKQTGTSMGAWAEFRHAVSITQTTSAHFGAAIQSEPEFVEPVPEFFHMHGRAAERLGQKSHVAHLRKEDQGAAILAVRLEEFVEILRSLKGDGMGFPHPFLLPQWNKMAFKMEGLFPGESPAKEDGGGWDLYLENDRKALIPKIEEACQKFWGGDRKMRKRFQSANLLPSDQITHRILQLSILCFRLEGSARKQLAGLELSNAEANVIDNIGPKLGYLMFYEGSSYLAPNDDAPKMIQVAHLGLPDGEKVLQVGVARPRQILVRYPNREGKPVFCQGAVYTYRERISEKSLTDEEWRKVAQESKTPGWLSE